jgi:hypothetical protein
MKYERDQNAAEKFRIGINKNKLLWDSTKARGFVPGKPFQPSLIWVRPGAYPRLEHLKGASLR